jgi:hypothetical protein
MRSRTPRLVLTAIAIVIAFAIPATANAANSTGADMFGVSVGGTLQNEDPATLAKDLDALQGAGARWVRVDINWAQIQNGGPSSYAWTSIDNVVQGATARGIKVLGVIVYTPGWARPSGSSATYGPDPAKYAAFARTAVQHYAAMGVHTYEVWNEPNTQSFWTPTPSPSAYTQLLKAAYPAIKSADPQSTVLSAGTAPAPSDGTNYSPVDFLKGIYANGGGGSFDAVSHHPYCFPANPGDAQTWSSWYQMYGTSPSLRSVMVANGDGAKKIWATEFGAPTNGPSGYVSESAQAAMIAKAYTEWGTYDWGGPLFTYQGRDLGTSTSSSQNFFGLLHHDFTPKPAYAAYKTAANSVTTDPPPPPPPPPPTDTTTTVRGNGHGHGGGVMGKVLAEAPAGKRAMIAATGRVKLSLYRRHHLVWRRASHPRTVRVTQGSFDRRMRMFHRHLHSGTYRVVAHYLGSHTMEPSRSESGAFTLHG